MRPGSGKQSARSRGSSLGPVLLTGTSSLHLLVKPLESPERNKAVSPFKKHLWPLGTQDLESEPYADQLRVLSAWARRSQHPSGRSRQRQALIGHPNRVIASSFGVSLSVPDQESSFWKQVDQKALCNLLGNLCEPWSPQLGPDHHHRGLRWKYYWILLAIPKPQLHILHSAGQHGERLSMLRHVPIL